MSPATYKWPQQRCTCQPSGESANNARARPFCYLQPSCSHRVLTYMVNAGILTGLASACRKACGVLQQQGSTAALHWSFTQYVAALLALWNDLQHLLPNEGVNDLEDGDALAEQLLPGAQPAAAALTTYLGPAAAAINSSDGRVSGCAFQRLPASAYTNQAARASSAATGPAAGSSSAQPGGGRQGQQPSEWRGSTGRLLATAAVAHALRVAETLVRCCYFFFMKRSNGTAVVPPGEGLGQALCQASATAYQALRGGHLPSLYQGAQQYRCAVAVCRQVRAEDSARLVTSWAKTWQVFCSLLLAALCRTAASVAG